MANEMNNRQAYFNYHIEDKYVAGIVLLGTEVKSIRDGKLSFNDAFCLFDDGELWMRGLFIASYTHGTANNHIAVHDRKLLLNKKELKKIQGRLKEKGYTIVKRGAFGRMDGVMILPNGNRVAAGDKRGDDSVAGY